MKNRFYTFLIRWYSAQSKPLPQWLDRASTVDTDLAVVRSEEETLSDALKLGSEPSASVLDPVAMSAKIMASLDESGERDDFEETGSEEPSGGSVWRVVALPLAVAAAVAVFLTLGVSMQQSEGVPPVSFTEVQIEDVESTPADVEVASWQNPLDAEVENVLADAKGAVGFLASTFLPSSLAQGLLTPDQDAS